MYTLISSPKEEIDTLIKPKRKEAHMKKLRGRKDLAGRGPFKSSKDHIKFRISHSGSRAQHKGDTRNHGW